MARWAAEPPSDLEGPQADPDQVARTILLRRLEVAPRTRAELATTLRERGVAPEVAQRVLDRFEEVGLIDDRMFARMWVDSRQSSRGLSARALSSELRRRGVADELIREAIASVSAQDELDAAREIARRKVRSLGDLPRATKVRRLTGALARRGYGQGVAGQVVREVLDGGGFSDEASGAGWIPDVDTGAEVMGEAPEDVAEPPGRDRVRRRPHDVERDPESEPGRWDELP